MGKDKIFGFIILLLGAAMIVVYILWAPVSLFLESAAATTSYGIINWRWAVVIPLTLGVILFGLLASWIGYSMITTPPPVPLEELEEELEAEEAAMEDDDEEDEDEEDDDED